MNYKVTIKDDEKTTLVVDLYFSNIYNKSITVFNKWKVKILRCLALEDGKMRN